MKQTNNIPSQAPLRIRRYVSSTERIFNSMYLQINISSTQCLPKSMYTSSTQRIFNSIYLQPNISSNQCIPKSMYLQVSSTKCILNLCIFNLMYIPLNVLHCSYISFNSMRLELNASLKHCQRHNGPRLGVLRLD